MDHVQNMADDLVGCGVTLLDRHFDGPDWRRRIDMDTLDMVSLSRCVLGQLFGEYVTGLNALGLSYGSEHGFSPWQGVEAHTLRETWIKLLDI